MCKHNEEDYPCDDCCWEDGYDAAMMGEPDYPEYKNWSQCNAFHDGYAQASKERRELNGRIL